MTEERLDNDPAEVGESGEVGAHDERQVPGTAAPSQAPGAQGGLEVGDPSRVADLEDRLLRLAAEFDNYKKRVARERQEYTTLANERLIGELLPVLDDLERALEAASEHSARYGAGGGGDSTDERLRQAYADEAQLEEGVRLVHRSLAALLERQGVRAIDTEGKFDPHVHEALLSQPSEAEEGSVLDVIQKGYRLGERVVRPARVVVAAAPQEPEGDG